MIRKLAIVLVLLCLPSPLFAQATHISTSGTLPANCRVGDIYYKTGTSAGLYQCTATNTWTVTASGSVTATGTLTSGKAIIGNGTTDVTVSSATGVAHLSSGTLTGSNVNVASEITGTTPVANGGTNLTGATDDNVMVGNGTTWQSKALADCDASTNAVTYDTTTNTFGCNTITGSGGGGIGTVTNTGTLTSNALIAGNGGADIKVATAAANSKLLGSGASGSGSAYSELTLGTSLSMSGTTLNATAGAADETHTASSSASLDFTTCVSSSINEHEFVLTGILPATDNANLLMLVSTDGGSTWLASTTYRYGLHYISPNAASGVAATSTGAAQFVLYDGMSNVTSTNVTSGEVQLFNLGSSTRRKAVLARVYAQNGSAGEYAHKGGGGVLQTTTAINAVQFKFNTGNIAEGTIACYRKPN